MKVRVFMFVFFDLRRLFFCELISFFGTLLIKELIKAFVVVARSEMKLLFHFTHYAKQ